MSWSSGLRHSAVMYDNVSESHATVLYCTAS